jgi:hypothetical protein
MRNSQGLGNGNHTFDLDLDWMFHQPSTISNVSSDFFQVSKRVTDFAQKEKEHFTFHTSWMSRWYRNRVPGSNVTTDNDWNIQLTEFCEEYYHDPDFKTSSLPNPRQSPVPPGSEVTGWLRSNISNQVIIHYCVYTLSDHFS